MRVIGVVQARLSSQRLPGKILMPLQGRPSLDYLLDALAHATRLDGVVLATSDASDDDRTAAFAASRGIACFRGSLAHVALRLLRAGEAHGADAIVRVNGDSPLLDPALIDQAIGLFEQADADIVTNVRPRSFPKGQSVEVIATAALRTAVDRMTTSDEREHVTPYLYANPDAFRIRSFTADVPRPEIQLSIDDPADFARCDAILTVLGRAPWQAGWRACVSAYDQVAGVPRKEASS